MSIPLQGPANARGADIPQENSHYEHPEPGLNSGLPARGDSCDPAYFHDSTKAELGRALRLAHLIPGQELVVGIEGDLAIGQAKPGVRFLHACIRRGEGGAYYVRPFERDSDVYVAPAGKGEFTKVEGEVQVLAGARVRLGESYCFQLPPLELKRFEIGSPMLVGRHDNADVALTRAEPRLSRGHLIITALENGNYLVKDGHRGQPAKNGSCYLEGSKWVKLSEPRELSPGTLLLLADCMLVALPAVKLGRHDLARLNVYGSNAFIAPQLARAA